MAPRSFLRKSQELVDMGKRLRLLREVAELDQGRMAKAVGVDRTAWNKFEAGVSLISPIYVVQLCKRYKISAEYIYAGNLIGTNPELALQLAALDPQLLQNTTHTKRERGVT